MKLISVTVLILGMFFLAPFLVVSQADELDFFELFQKYGSSTDMEADKVELLESYERLRNAELIGKLGHWEIDFTENKVFLSDGAKKIYGIEGNIWDVEDIRKIPLPEYRPMLDKALYELINENKPYNVEFKIMRSSDKRIIDVHFVAKYDADDNTMLGVMHDITERKLAEAQLKRQKNIIIYSMIAFILVFLMFIVLLLKNIRNMKSIQEELTEQFRFGNLITDLSTSFVNSTVKNIDYKFQDMLEKVGMALGIERSYIFQFSKDKSRMTNTHEWCAEGVEFHKNSYKDTPISKFSWLTELLLHREYVLVTDVEELPYAATLDKNQLQSQGIQSLLCMPILVNDEVQGFIGFDVVKGKKIWTKEQIWFLSSLTNILTEALEKNKIEKILINEKERFRITLLSVGDGVIATDYHGIVNIINGVAQQLTGWTEEEAIGQPFEDVFNIINEYSREQCANPIEKVLNTGKIIGLANHTILIAKDGKECPIADSAAPIIGDKDEIEGVVLVFRDVTDERQRQANIEYLSYHDYLTGLYNRRFFEEELKRLDVERNLPISIIMADVNGLKLTNDAFGHEQGDRLLKKAAKIIKSECRSDDIIARLGGDEFVILLPSTDSEETEQMVRRIKTECSNVRLDSISLSISFGCSTKYNAGVGIHTVLKLAEDNMYKQKLYESPSMRGETINAIISTLHEKNIREEKHSNRVSNLCQVIGMEMGLKGRDINDLRTVGLLHDIGKIAIDEIILNKPGALIEEEWKEIKRHPEIGYRILSAVNDMSELAQYVLAHQERWDGTGYPKGLKGQEIPLFSRILAVADAYDAMISDRAYRKAFSEEVAVDELRKNSGTQFDPDIVVIFIDKVRNKYL